MTHRTIYDAAASALWRQTETDWHAEVSLVLTEPVCAVVTLTPEDASFVGIKDFLGNDDANDSIRLACEHVLAKLKEEVGRKIIPYTEDRDAWYARIWGNGLPLVENGEPRYAVFVGRTVPKWDNTYANEADAKSRVHRLRNGRP